MCGITGTRTRDSLSCTKLSNGFANLNHHAGCAVAQRMRFVQLVSDDAECAQQSIALYLLHDFPEQIRTFSCLPYNTLASELDESALSSGAHQGRDSAHQHTPALRDWRRHVSDKSL